VGLAVGITVKGRQKPLARMIHQAGFDGIAVYIAQASQGILVVLHNTGLKAVTPKVPSLFVLLVERFRVQNLELAHDLGQIRFIFNADHHVEMVHHGNIGVDNHTIFDQYSVQTPTKHFPISLLFHEQPATIGAGCNVVG
jgi:hypothetical protein